MKKSLKVMDVATQTVEAMDRAGLINPLLTTAEQHLEAALKLAAAAKDWARVATISAILSS